MKQKQYYNKFNEDFKMVHIKKKKHTEKESNKGPEDIGRAQCRV